MLSNLFMTMAWHGHLKYLATVSWHLAALFGWAITLFEYVLRDHTPWTPLALSQPRQYTCV